MIPFSQTLHELTNENLVAKREFIIIPMNDDRCSYKTRFDTKHALLLIALLSDKHRRRKWLDNERLKEDHKSYIEFTTGYTNPLHQDRDRQI